VTRHVRSCRMGELLRDRRLLCRRAHRIAIRCHDPDRHSADRARSVTGSRRVCNPNEIFEAVIALADYAGCHSPPKRSRASVDSAFGGTMGTFYTRFHLPLPSCEGDCAPLFGGVVRPSGSLLDHVSGCSRLRLLHAPGQAGAGQIYRGASCSRVRLPLHDRWPPCHRSNHRSCQLRSSSE
jgi:hypothetical protein